MSQKTKLTRKEKKVVGGVIFSVFLFFAGIFVWSWWPETTGKDEKMEKICEAGVEIALQKARGKSDTDFIDVMRDLGICNQCNKYGRIVVKLDGSWGVDDARYLNHFEVYNAYPKGWTGVSWGK